MAKDPHPGGAFALVLHAIVAALHITMDTTANGREGRHTGSGLGRVPVPLIQQHPADDTRVPKAGYLLL